MERRLGKERGAREEARGGHGWREGGTERVSIGTTGTRKRRDSGLNKPGKYWLKRRGGTSVNRGTSGTTFF